MHRVIGFLAMAVAIAAGDAAAAEFKPVAERGYREYFNAANPVRGHAVVGAALLSPAAAGPPTAIRVFLPQPFAGELSVDVATADGRYRGEGVYAGSSPGQEWVTLSLVPQRPPVGASTDRPRDVGNLAVAVQRASDPALLLATWGQVPTSVDDGTVRLFVNSRRAEMYWSTADAEPVRCEPVVATPPVRFDAACDVPAARIPADGQVTLMRRDGFDTQLESVTVMR
jgi:hypothetical protein